MDHLQADGGPAGMSVRNFGLVWVSGRRSGAELDVARRARRRWEEVGASVPGIGFRPMSSLTVAGNGSARAVMEAFARHPDAAARSITFLEPDEVRACNPAVQGDIEDQRCTARRTPWSSHATALGAFHAHMAAVHGERYRFRPERRVVAAERRALLDTAGTRWEGDLVVLAPGAAYDQLSGSHTLAARLRRVRLQMLETASLHGHPHHVARRRRHAALLPGVRVGAAGPNSVRRPRWRPHTTCSSCSSDAQTAD